MAAHKTKEGGHNKLNLLVMGEIEADVYFPRYMAVKENCFS